MSSQVKNRYGQVVRNALVIPYVAVACGALALVAVSLFVGSGSLSSPQWGALFLELRAIRAATAFLAGGCLAVAGVLVQGLFQNPLASPSVLGTTAGASVGGQCAVIAPVVVPALAPFAVVLVPIGCLTGAAASLAVLLLLYRRTRDPLTLLLTGFILSAFLLSLGGFLTAMAQETWELGRAIVAFSLGGLGGVTSLQLQMAAPVAFVGWVAAWAWSKPLDVLQSGADEATALGVDVFRVRIWTAAWASALVAAAVSVGGGVSFVGLVVPHALRPFVGEHHRALVPAAALLGGAALVACDMLARGLPARGEVPLGVVTGLIGAPVFLALLFRTQNRATDHA